MNAVAKPTAREMARPLFPAVVLTYTDLLRVLAEADTAMPEAELAEKTDRVLSNVKRDLPKLRDAGVISFAVNGWVVSDKGRQWLLGQDVAAGRATAPANDGPPATVDLRWDEIEGQQDWNARVRTGLFNVDEEDMANSIVEKGILQAISVRPPVAEGGRWRLHIGKRRHNGWRRAVVDGRLPDTTTFPCKIFYGDDAEADEAALIENLQRSDLDPLEEAEGLLHVAERHNLSAAELARRIGKQRPDEFRKIEQRLSVARKATAENKARYIAHAQGEPGSEVFTWTDLRNSVQAAKHVTALERSPMLAMLIVELAANGARLQSLWDLEADLAPSAATDGILAHAIELGLVHSYAPGTAMLTQLGCDWVADQNFAEDAEAVLARVREAALGPMVAAALAPSEWGSAVLNLPPAATEPEPGAAPEPGSDPSTEPDRPTGYFVDQDHAEDEDVPAFLRRLAGGGAPPPPASSASPDAQADGGPTEGGASAAPAQVEREPETPTTASPPPPPPVQETLTLQPPSMLASVHFMATEKLILLEVAHASAASSLTARTGDPAVAIAQAFQQDRAAAGLPMKRAIGFVQRPTGGWMAFLPPAARRLVDDWRPDGVDLNALDEARAAAGVPADTAAQLRRDGQYATGWLNVAAAREEAPPAVAPPAAAPQAPSPAQGGDLIVRLSRAAHADLYVKATTALRYLNRIKGTFGQGDEEAYLAAEGLQQSLLTSAEFIPAEVKASVAAAPEQAA